MFQDLATYLPIADPTWIFFVVLSIILIAPMLLERLRIPAIVGMIAAGVLIGPFGFNILERDASFELFGKVGLYYIMFLAAMEMNMQDVQKIRGRAVTLGLLSFGLPMIVGFAANSLILGYAAGAAMLMAAMYASHTLVAYPVVMRYGLARRSAVSIAVGATIVADTLTLLVLAVVSGTFKDGQSGFSWVWLLLRVIVLGGVIVAVFPRLARWFFRRYDEGVVQYVFVLALVFLGAGLMEFVGMEGILGAFLVGIVLNRTIPPSSPLMNHLEFVGNALFIPYFLIGVGMLLNVRAFVEHSAVFLIAAVMTAVGISTKWFAAFLTQKLFHMPVSERRLMFGLTNSRAAATLAVVLVGYGIVLTNGERLLGEDVLNGTMMFILITCIVSSIATENVSRRIAESATPDVSAPAPDAPDRILIAVNNPDTLQPLIGMGLMLRTPQSLTPLTAVNVVLDGASNARDAGAKQLEEAVKIAAAANVRLVTRSRWSVNVVSGISHTTKEFDASDLLIGLHQKTSLSDGFFGKAATDLIAAVEKQIFIFRPVSKMPTASRIHLVLPRKSEFEPGFQGLAVRIALLASQLSCRVDTYSGRGTLAALQQVWDERGMNVEAEHHIYNEWHDFITVAHAAKQDHLVVFVMARRGTLSFHHYMTHLPEQLERYFSARHLLVIYPAQPASSSDGAALRAGGVPLNTRES